PARSSLLPYTTLFRSKRIKAIPDNQTTWVLYSLINHLFQKKCISESVVRSPEGLINQRCTRFAYASNGSPNLLRKKFSSANTIADRKSTRLNSSHVKI